MNATKIVKPRVARKIVKTIRCGSPPGRFLKKKKGDNKWYDVGDRHASEKTSQALREKSQEEKRESRARNANSKRKIVDMGGGASTIVGGGGTPSSSKSAKGEEKKKKKGEDPDAMTPVMPSPYPPNVPPGLIMTPYAYYPMQPYPGAGFSPYYALANHHLPKGIGIGLEGEDKESITTSPYKVKQENDNGDDNDNKRGDIDSSPTKKRDPPAAGEEDEEHGHDGDKSIPPPPSLLTLSSAQPQNYPVEGGIFGAVDTNGDIIVTERDILCGRGGATNHHKVRKIDDVHTIIQYLFVT
jgi:hypothetical protein